MQKKIGYWAATGLVAFAIGMGGVMDLVAPPDLVEGMAHLGYPAYFMLILGLWKVAGAVVLLLPRTPLLKEWAYAGIAFDLTGAAASHAFSGDTLSQVLTPLVILGLLAASWALRPQPRRLSLASVPQAA
jgi:hypothetical protein